MVNDTLTNGLDSSLGIPSNNQKPYTYHDDFDYEEFITDYLMEEELENDPSYCQDFHFYRTEVEDEPPTYHDDFDYEEFITHSLIESELLEFNPDSIDNTDFYIDNKLLAVFYESYYPYQSSYDLECEDEFIRQENCEQDFQIEKYISKINPSLSTVSELMRIYRGNFGWEDFWDEDMKSAESLNEKVLFSLDYFRQMEEVEKLILSSED